VNATAKAVAPLVPLIRAAAEKHGVAPLLVAAVVAQESGGPYVRADGSANPYAIRIERGFWRRYYDSIAAFVSTSKSKRDDRWHQYPDLYACSFGLMQVLYQTAREHGFDPQFPTELCDPELGLDAGCAILARHLARTGGDWRTSLLRYNGGGNPKYPDDVLAKLREIREAGLFSA